MSANLDWQEYNVLTNDLGEYGTTSVSFDGLEGTFPGCAIQGAALSQMHGFFGFNAIRSLSFSNDISFASITLVATVPDTNVGSGLINYTPLTDDGFEFIYHSSLRTNAEPFVSLVPLTTPVTTNTTTLITFDDLADGAVVPNGYDGLQWSDFAVIGDQNPFAIDGYASGVVSPDNVAYNPYGEPATIRSSNKFDLVSAYLTAAVMSAMEIEVQGFDGINLPYDEAFTLSTNGPQLINFNYVGVDRVKFIPRPGGQFVMDNLSVVRPSILTLTNSHPIDLGQVEVPSVGHTFAPVVQAIPGLPILPNPIPYPWPLAYQVTDFLVDQLQESGGGGVTALENANFDANNQFTLTIAAPPGKKFHVHVPAGQSVKIDAYLDWQASDPFVYGPGEYGRTEISFGDLEGAAPGYYEYTSFLLAGDRSFGFGFIDSMAITNDLSFTSITLLATIPNTNVGPGLLSYTPFSDNNFEFYYTTAQTSDPGPFITLDSTSPLVNTNSHPVDLGTVEVPTIGHTFVPPLRPIPLDLNPIVPIIGSPWSSKYQVNDFLVDQRRGSRGGGVTAPVSANFATNNQFMLTIAAPPGEKFHVHVPAGQVVMMNAFLDWQENPLIFGVGAFGSIAISFANLEGTPPGSYFDSSFLSPTALSFGFDIFDSMPIANDISFSAITLLATVPETNMVAGPAYYVPYAYNAFKFYYTTTQPNDPGPFITLDSTNPPAGPGTNLITFDDLLNRTVVPDSYGGLQWNNFEVLSATDPWNEGGYQKGIISPSNEVFNPYGNPASVSSGNKFDLVSAYLTAAVLPTLQIEVQGFANGVLAYDRTYPLADNSPHFLTFNYSGVNQVKFITTPSSQFAMDNLTVVVNDAPT